jgi:hypothetical protein
MAHTYQPPHDGVCRGLGGADDKLISKYVHERTIDACRADCDDEPDCTGFSYHPTANGGQCMVHGPGMAGKCSASATSPTACAALGSCSDTSKTTEDTCGTCSESTAGSESACKTVEGTWTAGTWTSAGATWIGPDDPWKGDWGDGALIIKHYVASTPGGFTCYDVDPTDHQAKCTGSDAKCAAAFAGKEKSEQVSGNCPDGCTFAAAPRPVANHPPHPGVEKQPGYSKYMSGCCRGTNVTCAEGAGEQIGVWGGCSLKIDGKYSKTSGKDGVPMTQAECAGECNSYDGCLGYCNGAGWCVLYGTGIHDTVTEDDPWGAGYYYAPGPITHSKPSNRYICAVRDGPGADDQIGSASVHVHSSTSILLGGLISTCLASSHHMYW